MAPPPYLKNWGGGGIWALAVVVLASHLHCPPMSWGWFILFPPAARFCRQPPKCIWCPHFAPWSLWDTTAERGSLLPVWGAQKRRFQTWWFIRFSGLGDGYSLFLFTASLRSGAFYRLLWHSSTWQVGQAVRVRPGGTRQKGRKRAWKRCFFGFFVKRMI